jgi:hypothetical protein
MRSSLGQPIIIENVSGAEERDGSPKPEPFDPAAPG